MYNIQYTFQTIVMLTMITTISCKIGGA